MREKVKEIMKTVFELPSIPDDVSKQDCLQWDSLHHLSLVIELESAFNIAFEPEEINKMVNLETIESVLANKAVK